MSEIKERPQREIRARFSDKTVRVYQAYSSSISEAAMRAQKFVSPFRMERMTWIKPSFFWMMYRSGWATKAGQERVLAIDITRDGFEWAIRNGCLSHYDPDIHESWDAWEDQKRNNPVRIQWDPERNCHLERLDCRSIQIGLSGDAVHRYVNDWIRTIIDITDEVRGLRDSDMCERQTASAAITSEERPYPMPPDIVRQIGGPAT